MLNLLTYQVSKSVYENRDSEVVASADSKEGQRAVEVRVSSFET